MPCRPAALAAENRHSWLSFNVEATPSRKNPAGVCSRRSTKPAVALCPGSISPPSHGARSKSRSPIVTLPAAQRGRSSSIEVSSPPPPLWSPPLWSPPSSSWGGYTSTTTLFSSRRPRQKSMSAIQSGDMMANAVTDDVSPSPEPLAAHPSRRRRYLRIRNPTMASVYSYVFRCRERDGPPGAGARLSPPQAAFCSRSSRFRVRLLRPSRLTGTSPAMVTRRMIRRWSP